jgi:hypothetical protein
MKDRYCLPNERLTIMNFQKNLGMLLLAIYLILVGLMALLPGIVIPAIVMGILALAAGILILIGK